MFVRRSRDLPASLDWHSICVRTRGRPCNTAHESAESAWDWFPDPNDPAGPSLASAVERAAQMGARSFIMNAEKEFRGRPRAALEYASAARAHTARLGMFLGLVSYSVPSTVRNFPWAEFAEYCDFGVPEIYDREGRFDPKYPPRAIKSWTEHGFDVLPACGLYQRDHGGPWRWRTEAEMLKHLGLFPCNEARIAWPIKGRPPAGTVRGLVSHQDRT